MSTEKLPKHWDPDSTRHLVELPVPTNHDRALVKTLLAQGRTKEEVSSLLEAPADYNLQKGNGYCPTGHFLTMPDEVHFVLDHVEGTSGGQIGAQKVQCLERIQNATVWRTYATRRSQLLSQGWREILMFHGTSKQSLASIAKTGFMTSYSMAGGQALYFARACSTSLGYSQKPNGQDAPCPESAQDLTAEPSFISHGFAMLLCKVLVSPEMMASSQAGHQVGDQVIVTIDSNDLAYPEYIIHYCP